MIRTTFYAGTVRVLEGVRGVRPYQVQPCPYCRAPVVIPAEAGWTIDLIKFGPPDGPVAALLVPHRPECPTEAADPDEGFAVRVAMTSLGVDEPERHEFSPFTFSGPGGPDVVADWCGYGALQEALLGLGFCGRAADDEVHGGGHG